MGLAMAAGESRPRRAPACVERRRHASRPTPAHAGVDRSFHRALRAWLGDAAAWREQLYLLLRFAAGLPAAVIVVSVIGAALTACRGPGLLRVRRRHRARRRAHGRRLPEALALRRSARWRCCCCSSLTR